MDFVIYKPIEVFSQFFIPIFLLIAASIINLVVVTIYSKIKGKNKYIKTLRDNFPIIDTYLNLVQGIKSSRQRAGPIFLGIGALLGILIVQSLYPLMGEPFIYILNKLVNINYIGEYILSFVNNLELLDARLIYFSYSYTVLIIIIILAWTLWVAVIRSKKLYLPKIQWHNSANPNKIAYPLISWKFDLVYAANWIFIGIVFGVYFVLLLIPISIMENFSIIPDWFSYNLTSLKTVYFRLDAETAYLEFYKIIFFVGLVFIFIIILAAHSYIRFFSNEVERLITNYFKYDFPEVIIRTENCEVKGQIKNILDKSLVTVSEKNVIKIVP